MVETRYTEGGYLAQNPDWHAVDSPAKAGWIRDLLTKNGIVPKSLAEVGCGAGGILAELHGMYPETDIFGYEVSTDAYKICSLKAADRLNYVLEDITKALHDPFDVLLVIDVFEHVPDYIGFIRDLKSHAEYKIFHVPLDLSVQALVRSKGFGTARAKLGHLHYFYKESALATLRDCGYEIVDWRYTHGTEELPNQSLRSKFLSIPRKATRIVNTDFSVRIFGGSSMLILTR